MNRTHNLFESIWKLSRKGGLDQKRDARPTAATQALALPWAGALANSRGGNSRRQRHWSEGARCTKGLRGLCIWDVIQTFTHRFEHQADEGPCQGEPRVVS